MNRFHGVLQADGVRRTCGGAIPFLRLRHGIGLDPEDQPFRARTIADAMWGGN